MYLWWALAGFWEGFMMGLGVGLWWILGWLYSGFWAGFMVDFGVGLWWVLGRVGFMT